MKHRQIFFRDNVICELQLQFCVSDIVCSIQIGRRCNDAINFVLHYNISGIFCQPNGFDAGMTSVIFNVFNSCFDFCDKICKNIFIIRLFFVRFGKTQITLPNHFGSSDGNRSQKNQGNASCIRIGDFFDFHF